MSLPTTGIGFSPSTPAAPAGYANAVPQGDNGSPQEKFSFYTPNSGGVSAKTASYTAVAADNGTLLSFNSASAVTLTLPATAPFSKWRIAVQNIGAGALTISPGSLTIDGAASSLTLAQNAGCWLFSDGTNYFSERSSGSGGGVSVKTASYTAAAGDDGRLISFNSSSAVTLTLPATPPSSKWRIAVQNIGAGTLTVSPGGLTIDGATASLSLAQNTGCWVFSDGINYFSERGSGSGGGGATTYYGNSYVNSSSAFQEIILGSTPLAGSVSVFIDGALISPGDYTLSGTMVTLSSPYYGSHVVVATWATSNSTPGTISVSSGGIGNPVLRGTGIQYATTASVTVPLPSGTVAGDLAVIFLQTAYNITTPSGWTANDLHNGATVNGAVFSKILTSTDISAGSVTISLGGAYGATVSIATFVGNTAGIRETVVNTTTTSPSNSIVMTSTSGSVLNTDTALYFGAARQLNGAVTINRGVSKQASAGAQSSGALYAETLTASGAVQPTVTYPAAATSGYYQCTVIVKGV